MLFRPRIFHMRIALQISSKQMRKEKNVGKKEDLSEMILDEAGKEGLQCLVGRKKSRRKVEGD
jgi:hypothetical protein